MEKLSTASVTDLAREPLNWSFLTELGAMCEETISLGRFWVEMRRGGRTKQRTLTPLEPSEASWTSRFEYRYNGQM